MSTETNENNEQSQTPDTVAYETHKKLLDQRKADQAKLRQIQEERDALKAAQEQAENDRLVQQKQFETIAQKEKERADKLASDLQGMQKAQTESAKKAALKAALGGVKKDEYLQFANLEQIQIVDGVVDADSVAVVAAAFRESHGDLIVKPAATPPPGGAPSPFKSPAPVVDTSVAGLRQAFINERLGAK